MTPVRLGAVSYLNTRPLVCGLERSSPFDIRFDVPSRCAELLHEGAIDVGLIPSIEYVRGAGREPYSVVPGVSLASRGAVASVALYTSKSVKDVRSVAMDRSSRTSVALLNVLCARLFKIAPDARSQAADLQTMLASCDAALIIGDNALFQAAGPLTVNGRQLTVEKIDLGAAWTRMTGLPFVYAFWAGRPGALTADHVAALQRARDEGIAQPDEIARQFFGDDPRRCDIATRYLRDNMKYDLGEDALAGLRLFYRYAVEAGCIPSAGELRFYP